MREEEVLQEKVKVFWKRQIPVHIIYKNGSWENGIITECSADFFMLDEFTKGLMPVFFLELKNIESFLDRKNKNE